MAESYYEILGVSRDATTAEIKSAFRRIARESHPDANPNNPAAEARFRAAAEAYEVLSNGEKRRRYDRGDTIDIGDLFGGGFGGFEDILRSVFGDGGLFGNATGGRQARGRDVLVRTEITLEQAAFGCDVDVQYEAPFACELCGGLGAESHDGLTTCSTCGGAGSVRMARRSIVGTMMTVTECPDCSGIGTRILEPCAECEGMGTQFGDRTVTVEIPPGVSSGTRLRLTGRGESVGRLGPTGDLHVEIEVADDERFERVDTDLVHRVEIGIAEATLGTRTKVPLLDGGAMDLEIPAGTQPGSLFRIEGHGIPRLRRRGRGDLIVVAEVRIPTGLTEAQAGLLRDFADLQSDLGSGDPPDQR